MQRETFVRSLQIHRVRSSKHAMCHKCGGCLNGICVQKDPEDDNQSSGALDVRFRTSVIEGL